MALDGIAATPLVPAVEAVVRAYGEGALVHAAAEIVVLGAVCGPLGVWVLAFRQSYAAEALAHGMVLGLVAATLLGVPLAAGAAGGALLGATGAGLAGRDRRLGTDLGVGVTITAALGAGALLALLGPDPERLEALLFGDLLGVSWLDVVVSTVLAGAVLAALWAGRRALAVCALDPGVAPSLGYRPPRVEGLLLVALAGTLVAAVAATGSLLALALVVAPAAAARRLTGRLGRVLPLAAVLAAAAGLAGLALGLWLGLEPSAAVALMAIATFVLASSAARGLKSPLKPL